jgi:hypothetical protein
LLVVLVILIASAGAELIEGSSFAAPFDDVGSSGKRMIEGWTASGDTDIKQNFARLTTDRQSKRGTLWSKSPVGAFREISAILTFRISGQGKKLFGDGIGLWLTQFNRQQQGSLHGIDGKFVGVSVIIDTFKNVEHGGKHRDVTILVNNGEEEVRERVRREGNPLALVPSLPPPSPPLPPHPLRSPSVTTRTPSAAMSMDSATMRTGTTSPSSTLPAFVSSLTRTG